MQKDGPADEDDGTDDKGMTEEGGGDDRRDEVAAGLSECE